MTQKLLGGTTVSRPFVVYHELVVACSVVGDCCSLRYWYALNRSCSKHCLRSVVEGLSKFWDKFAHYCFRVDAELRAWSSRVLTKIGDKYPRQSALPVYPKLQHAMP